MTNLITEARELIEALHAGEYDDEYIGTGAYLMLDELCDALEKAEREIEQMRKAVSRYCRNDCFRDACAGNEDVGIPDCSLAKYSPPLPAPPEEGE